MESQEANYNPANTSSLSGAISEVLKNFGLSQENCIPAVVVSYDRQANTAVVQPAINCIATSGESLPRDTMRLPVHIGGGGGIVMAFPLKKDDTGWIIASDRDISLFKQSLKVSNPNTYQTHKYSFGFFVPDKIKGYTLNQADNNNFVLQTLDGSTRISLGDGVVNIISKNGINSTAQNLTITIPTITITGDINITGDVNVTGKISATDEISSDTDVKSAGISGKLHVHTGNMGQDTSPPH